MILNNSIIIAMLFCGILKTVILALPALTAFWIPVPTSSPEFEGWSYFGYLIRHDSLSRVLTYEAVSDQGPVWVRSEEKILSGFESTRNIIFSKYIRGSVRSGSGLSQEGCNFSRFLKSGFEWLNMFQLMYSDVVRENFTKKSPDHLF